MKCILLVTMAASIFFTACGAREQAASTTELTSSATTPATTADSATPAGSSTPAVATHPYDAAMQKLEQASSYRFVYTSQPKGGTASKAAGLSVKANRALQFAYENSSDPSRNGEWIDIENGKQVWWKQNGAWSDQGFITPPGVGFSMGMMVAAITLRNSTDPANSAPPAPKGIETVEGQECDHYQVTLPAQSYDVYVSRSSGDLVRARFTDGEEIRTLTVTQLNEPATIAPPV